MTITNNSSAPIVVIVGSTGGQGRSVIKALSESDRPYRIRGLTRDSSKPVAQELASQGVHLVQIDPNPEDPQTTFEAFRGATYAFINTLTSTKEKEIAEGKLFADASKATNIQLVIWSGLESLDENSGGKYPHVDLAEAKVAVTRYLKELGVPFVNVEAGMYMQNFNGFGAPRKQPGGWYRITRPAPASCVVPLIDIDLDYGLFVRKALEQPSDDEIRSYGELISYGEMAQQLAKITGKDVRYVESTGDEFVQIMQELGVGGSYVPAFLEMYQAIAEFGYYGPKDLSRSLHGLARRPRTWEEFVKATDWSQILA